LHGNVFKPHTGTKTSVLFVQKWDEKLCPKVDDYPIFFATMQEPSKDNSGEKIFVRKKDFPKNSPSSLKGCPEIRDGVVDFFTIRNTKIYKHYAADLPYNPDLKPRASELRKAGNLAEVLFWQQVHKKKFWNIDFDRQRIIGNYIVDFYAKSLSFVIEIDGASHNDKVEYDAERQKFLESLGLKVYRIDDKAIKQNLDAVMKDLEAFIIREFSTSCLSRPADTFILTSRPTDTPLQEGNLGQEKQEKKLITEIADHYVNSLNELDQFLLDKHGHLIVKHDLFNHDGLTKNGIAEAFAEFAKKENLSFF
jgi:very-short-patch-repair endonuclease